MPGHAANMPSPVNGLAGSVAGFCRFARLRGLNVGIRETLDALAACRLGLLPEKNSFRLALRALLCTSKEERDLFDRLFAIYWEGRPEIPKRKSTGPAAGDSRPGRTSPLLAAMATLRKEAPESDGMSSHGACARERLQQTDFSLLSEQDQDLLEELSLRLWRRMSRRLNRRLKASSSRRQVHLRRTIRRSIPCGGEPLDLCYRNRRPRKPRLALLLDVSGSMDQYSFFLLRFVYALQHCFQRVDSFTFSTRLTCITDALRANSLNACREALAETADAWSSGTRIGDCLGEFNRGYASRVLSRRGIVIILSDGLDTGEPEALQEQLRLVKRRCRKLIWLNPLKGMAGYRPLARGIQAALPLVDAFLPAHNLDSLLELEGHLLDV